MQQEQQHQNHQPTSDPPKSGNRLLNVHELTTTGQINDFHCDPRLLNTLGLKPVLKFHTAQPLLFHLEFGRSKIQGPEMGILQSRIIAPHVGLSLRDILTGDDNLIAKALCSMIAPITRIQATHAWDGEHKQDLVQFSVTMSDERHMFVAKLADVPELRLA